MTAETLKNILQGIVVEAVEKAKEDFDKLPPEMNATEALQNVLSANFGHKFDERLFRTAKQFGIPNLGTEGLRAHVKGIAMGTDKSKPIDMTLKLENTLDNRIALAHLDGTEVNLYGAQLDIEAYAKRKDEEREGQEELDLGGDETEEAEGEAL